ncbi:MAG: pyroglutamyl-peptidase I [Ramlibacter sp.]|nr:pyroglutamyl-peptidase I [Ramlibacter sp.]
MVAALKPVRAPWPVVLVTGFDAFGGDSVNPSWLAALALHGRRIAGHRIVGAQLPTEFDRSLKVLAALLREHHPVLVLCLGQAGGRAAVSLERVAINVNDARIPDNALAQPVDTPVVPGGPAAYFTRLPVKAMHRALLREGVPAEVSQTAGTFVCNHVFYGLMHTLATRRGFRRVRGGFIHVPWLPDQGQPCMALDDMVRGLALAVREALRTPVDVAEGAGALH